MNNILKVIIPVFIPFLITMAIIHIYEESLPNYSETIIKFTIKNPCARVDKNNIGFATGTDPVVFVEDYSDEQCYEIPLRLIK